MKNRPRLSDILVKKLQPKDKVYRIYDQGLYLEVHPTGSKYWRYKYRFNGKEKKLAFGVYPSVSLKEAREKRDEAKKALTQGNNPVLKSGGDNFETISREWFKKFSVKWAKGHSDRVIRLLERDIFPILSNRPIKDISSHEILQAIRFIEDRGALETSHRALQTTSQVFRYAIASGKAERNPANDLKGALATPIRTHFAALTDPKKVGELLIAIENYKGQRSPVIKAALRLSPLVFVRPNELRKMEWSEVDFNSQLWTIPANKMKMKRDHIVPLSNQAMTIIQNLKYFTNKSQYVFPTPRDKSKPMSDNGVRSALWRLGYKDEMTGHGFRAMARTLLDEVLKFRPDIIEHQLAHTVKDPNGRAYNRTSHLEERKKMMQDWADYLDELKKMQSG